MISTLAARQLELGSAIEMALVEGNLDRLNIPQRLDYYKAVCGSLGLNPLTKPYDYIKLNGKLVLYPNGNAADQLRAIHKVSITRLDKKTEDGLYEVTAYGSLPDGRTDQATAFVQIDNLKGADRANAKMKTETKAKRRLTLSIVGLAEYAGVELSDEQEAQYKTIDPEASPIITAREIAVTAERAARPVQEWTEELDEQTVERTTAPAWEDLGTSQNVEPPKAELKIDPLPTPPSIPSHTNGDKTKKAQFRIPSAQMVAKARQYEYITADENDQVAHYHLATIAGNAGFADVTAANAADVWNAVSRHFENKKDLQPA